MSAVEWFPKSDINPTSQLLTTHTKTARYFSLPIIYSSLKPWFLCSRWAQESSKEGHILVLKVQLETFNNQTYPDQNNYWISSSGFRGLALHTNQCVACTTECISVQFSLFFFYKLMYNINFWWKLFTFDFLKFLVLNPIKSHIFANENGKELGLRAASCCVTSPYVISSRRSKDMGARQQSSGQDEWQGN